MKTLRIGLPLVNADYLPLDYSSCKEAIHDLVTDGLAPPPRNLPIEAKTREGKTVRILIPFEEADNASACIADD